MSSDEIQELIVAKGRILASQYSVVVAFTLYAYDIWISLDDQIEFVLKRKLWSFPSILYLGNRHCTYMGLLFVAVVTSPYCPPLPRGVCQQGFVVVLYCIATICWSGIMALRVAALWKSSAPVVWFVWGIWGIFSIWSAFGPLSTYVALYPQLDYNKELGLCAPKNNVTVNPRIQTATPVVQFVFSLILTVLTIIKAWFLRNPFNTLGISSIANILLHDGILYLLVVTALTFTSTLGWFLVPDAADRMYMFIYIKWAILSLLVGRFFTRLRKVYDESLMPTATSQPFTTYNITTISHNFAKPEHGEEGFFYYDDFATTMPPQTESVAESTEQGVALDLIPPKRDVEALPASKLLQEMPPNRPS